MILTFNLPKKGDYNYLIENILATKCKIRRIKTHQYIHVDDVAKMLHGTPADITCLCMADKLHGYILNGRSLQLHPDRVFKLVGSRYTKLLHSVIAREA